MNSLLVRYAFFCTPLAAVTSSCGGGDDRCMPGQSIACAGPGGCPGYQTCRADRSGYNACICAGDGGSPEAGSPGSDGASPRPDTGAPDQSTEAGAGSGDANASDRAGDAPAIEGGSGEVAPAVDSSSTPDAPSTLDAPSDIGVNVPDGGAPPAGRVMCAQCPEGFKVALRVGPPSGASFEPTYLAGCVPKDNPWLNCANPDRNAGTCAVMNATRKCAADGTCSFGICDPSWDNCDGVASNGCETDLRSVKSCAACGRVCGASQFCTPEGCKDTCAPPFTACGGQCVDLYTDPKACGVCGRSCNGGVCNRGVCEAPSCATRPSMCPDLMQDHGNCGAPGKFCMPPMGGVAYCANGTCQSSCAPGHTLCGDACALLVTDAANCGACGKACAMGESCVNSRCTARADLLLVTGLAGPEDILVDEARIYWTDPVEGTVRSLAKTGGGLNALASSQRNPLRLAQDQEYLYWGNLLGGAIMKVKKSGGEPTVVAATVRPKQIVVAGASVYWLQDDGNSTPSLLVAPKAGGEAKPVVTLRGSTHELATDGRFIYITGGDDPTPVIDTASGDAVVGQFGATRRGLGIAITPAYIFFSYLGAGGVTAVFVRDRVASDSTEVHIFGSDQLLADGCGVYSLRAVPLATRSPISIGAGGSGRRALDGQYIYWIDKTVIGRTPIP